MNEPIYRIEGLIEEHVSGEEVKEKFYLAVIDIMALIGKEEYGKHFSRQPKESDSDLNSDGN
jgi:hypothetical protein